MSIVTTNVKSTDTTQDSNGHTYGLVSVLRVAGNLFPEYLVNPEFGWVLVEGEVEWRTFAAYDDDGEHYADLRVPCDDDCSAETVFNDLMICWGVTSMRDLSKLNGVDMSMG